MVDQPADASPDENLDHLRLNGDDAELFKQLVRVSSSLKFRQWVRRVIWLIGAVAVLALLAGMVAIVAVRRVNDLTQKNEADQQQNCQQDNRLRAAYLHQWQPLVDDARTKDDPQSRAVVQRFGDSLADFALHPC